MIVVMAAHATEEQIKDVEKRIADWGYGAHPIYGEARSQFDKPLLSLANL